MSFTARVTKTITEGSTTITKTNTYTVETSYKLQETVTDGETNTQFLLAIDQSELKAYGMSATQAMTVYTNDAGTGTPRETFVLVANEPILFEDGIDSDIFAGDVTSIYVTNASGTDGVLNIVAAIDGP